MTQTDRCPQADRLRSFLHGEVRGAEADSLAAHLSACPRCLRTAQALGKDDTLVAALLSPADGATPSPELVRDLIERLRGPEPTAAGASEVPTLNPGPAPTGVLPPEEGY